MSYLTPAYSVCSYEVPFAIFPDVSSGSVVKIEMGSRKLYRLPKYMNTDQKSNVVNMLLTTQMSHDDS